MAKLSQSLKNKMIRNHPEPPGWISMRASGVVQTWACVLAMVFLGEDGFAEDRPPQIWTNARESGARVYAAKPGVPAPQVETLYLWKSVATGRYALGFDESFAAYPEDGHYTAKNLAEVVRFILDQWTSSEKRPFAIWGFPSDNRGGLTLGLAEDEWRQVDHFIESAGYLRQ